MENSSPLILEISSDEEAGFGDARKGSGFGVDEFGDREDPDWLSKLLGEVGGIIDDDSDDVVLVSEVFPRNPKKSRPVSLKSSAKVGGDEGADDDCVVLAGDPDIPLVVVTSTKGDADSDDLEIVGEKGEVACRDFPHPRHLCAKFSFASSPHEVHCCQCHCYVCDSLAPCSYWGSGISSIDHCHASDKEEYWKAERNRVKKGEKPVSVIPITSDTSLLGAVIQTTQVPAVTPPQPNPLVQDHGFSPVTTHPCSMPSNVGVPNAVNQIRNHPSGYVVPRYTPRPPLVSLQSHHIGDNNVPSMVASRDRSPHVGNRSLQPLTSHAIFKRHSFNGVSPNNRHAYRSPKRYRSFPTIVMNGPHCSNQQYIGSRAVNSVPQPNLPSRHSMNIRRANYLPSLPRVPPQPYSSSMGGEPIQCQSQMPSQPYVNRNFVSAVPLEPNVSSQPSLEHINNLVLPQTNVFQPNNPIPSQTVASDQSDACNAFGNQLHSGYAISSHLSVGNSFQDHSSQLQAPNNPSSSLIDGQNDVQQGDNTQNSIDVRPTDFGFFWNSSLNHGNSEIDVSESQYQSTETAGTSQLQNIPKNDNPGLAQLDDFPRQKVVLADYTSPTNDADSQFPERTEPGSLNFQLDSWMFENQSIMGALELSVSPNWNVFSPEPASTDTGTLFDI